MSHKAYSQHEKLFHLKLFCCCLHTHLASFKWIPLWNYFFWRVELLLLLCPQSVCVYIFLLLWNSVEYFYCIKDRLQLCTRKRKRESHWEWVEENFGSCYIIFMSIFVTVHLFICFPKLPSASSLLFFSFLAVCWCLHLSLYWVNNSSSSFRNEKIHRKNLMLQEIYDGKCTLLVVSPIFILYFLFIVSFFGSLFLSFSYFISVYA